MKSIIIYFLSLLTCCSSFAQVNKYGYPINSETKKITYEKTVSVEADKHNLFKYALQFIADQNFDRQLSLKTKVRRTYSNPIPVPKPIKYQDEEQGKIFGNGFIDFEYRGNNRFVITFSYKFYVQDKQYRYLFTDFIVKEYVYEGKSISGGPMGESNVNGGARIKTFTLEDFSEKNKYGKSDDEFSASMESIFNKIKVAMTGNL